MGLTCEWTEDLASDSLALGRPDFGIQKSLSVRVMHSQGGEALFSESCPGPAAV